MEIWMDIKDIEIMETAIDLIYQSKLLNIPSTGTKLKSTNTKLKVQWPLVQMFLAAFMLHSGASGMQFNRSMGQHHIGHQIY